jgi:hypothetical protein
MRWREDAAFNNAIKKQSAIVEAAKREAEQAKAVAADALQEAAQAKKELQRVREEADKMRKIFEANNLSFKQKMEAYEKLKANPVKPVDSNPDADVDDICERAKQLGVSCEQQ